MAVKIRLTRLGRKKVPGYRLVVTEERSKRDGRVIETIGNYNPRKSETEGGLTYQKDRAEYWISKGAQPTATVARLFRRAKNAAPAAVVA